MRSKFVALGAAALVAASTLALSSTAGADKSAKVLEWDTMAGNSRPYVGAGGAIRTVPAGGLPWVATRADGELRANGELEIDVEGLVIDPNDAAAQARGLAGTNPSPTFRAIVSCQTIVAGAAAVVNVTTDAVPASPAGDAEIETMVKLPSPCIAPIVFVTSGTGSWFLATGV